MKSARSSHIFPHSVLLEAPDENWPDSADRGTPTPRPGHLRKAPECLKGSGELDDVFGSLCRLALFGTRPDQSREREGPESDVGVPDEDYARVRDDASGD